MRRRDVSVTAALGFAAGGVVGPSSVVIGVLFVSEQVGATLRKR
jgi:hypothetical protein